MQENFPYEILIATTNITNGTRILNEMKPQEPSKLPDADADADAKSNSYNPFCSVCCHTFGIPKIGERCFSVEMTLF